MKPFFFVFYSAQCFQSSSVLGIISTLLLSWLKNIVFYGNTTFCLSTANGNLSCFHSIMNNAMNMCVCVHVFNSPGYIARSRTDGSIW